MLKLDLRFLSMLILSMLLLSACNKTPRTNSVDQEGPVLESPARPPVVNAGFDETYEEGTTIVLSGVAVSDNSEIAYYRWEQIDGDSTAVELTSPNKAGTIFQAPSVLEPIQLIFRLIVSDNNNIEAFDDVVITVVPKNLPPRVIMGEDMTVDELTFVNLEAEVSDSDGEILDFYWQKTLGSQDVQLLDQEGASVSFLAPNVDIAETYGFMLTATDDDGESVSRSINVTVLPASIKIIHGKVEKGPFQVGGELRFTSLLDNGVEIVDQLTTTVIDDLGSYSLGLREDGIYLAEAAGKYYGELDGLLSLQDVILQSIIRVELGSDEPFNLNILTHITTPRILWLIKVEGLDVQQAIIQAEAELRDGLKGVVAFPEGDAFAHLSIYGSNTQGASAHLLAISTLLLKYVDQSDNLSLQSVIDALGQDLAADGELNYSDLTLLGLIDAHKTLDPVRVSQSLLSLLGEGSDLSLADLNLVLDTDQDGVANAEDADDDNDNVIDQEDDRPYSANLLPIANAGSDHTVVSNSTVLLSGIASDADGEVTQIQWSQGDGALSVEIQNSEQINASFVAPSVTQETTINLILTVTDNENISSVDAVVITVLPENIPPTVSAGENQVVQELNTVTLEGMPSDSDGEVVNYLWTQEAGNDVSFLDNNDGSITFLAPTLEQSVTFTFMLTGTDDDGASASDTVNVTIEPAPRREVSGVVEKGPFALGGTLEFSLLFGDALEPVKEFSTVINDNRGAYSLSVSEQGIYAVAANGFYSSESTGLLSNEALSLESIYYLHGEEDLQGNVNVLTHIVSERVVQLIQEEELAATIAIAQAEQELVQAFDRLFSVNLATPFSQLSIFETAESVGSDYLLAISALIEQAAKNGMVEGLSLESGLQNLLDLLQQDFASDGLLDNSQSILASMQLAEQDLDPDAIQNSLVQIINGNAGMVPADINKIIDTDQDGLINNEDPDDDNDGLLDEDDLSPYSANIAPIVNAGFDQSVSEQTTIVLSGSATDSDGEIVSYLWEQTSGTLAVELSNAASAGASFIAPALQTEEQLEFTLTVHDDDNASATDTIVITVQPENTPPNVDIGDDRFVQELSVVNLIAEASDGDGEIVLSVWNQLSGTDVQLLDIGDGNRSFTAHAVEQAETLEFSFSATDNEGLTTVRSISVTIEPMPTRTVSGSIEKGPYALGSEITYSLLFEDESAPVKQHTAIVLGDIGRYEIEVNDNAMYQAEATGSYHSEVIGDSTIEELNLRAVHVVGEGAVGAYNVNVLTHIINLRVLWLIRVDELQPADAILQAESELKLALTNLLGEGPSENFSALSIFESDSAVGSDYLLALSVLLDQHASMTFTTTVEAQLQSILDTLEQDFASDGELDNSVVIFNGLQDAMTLLDVGAINANIELLIADQDGLSRSNIDNIIDTDLDGLVNSIDPDDDNDNLLDEIDPEPYFAGFLLVQGEFNTDEDIALEIDLEANSPGEGEITLVIENDAVNGRLSGDYPLLTYTPDWNYFGEDQFTYYLTQGDIVSEPVVISINVAEVNDPPRIWGSPDTIVNAFFEYSFRPTYSDIDTDDLEYTLTNAPDWLSMDDTGRIFGTPTNDHVGIYEDILISVFDGDTTVGLSPFSIQVNRNYFEGLAPMPMGNRYGAPVEFEGKIYYFGGYAKNIRGQDDLSHKDSWVYDIELDSWEVLDDTPESFFSLVAHRVGDLIYVIGLESGPDSINSVYSFDPLTSEWIKLSDRPVFASGVSSSVADGKIYLFGGVGTEFDIPASDGSAWFAKDYVHIYDPETNSWSLGAPMPFLSYGTCAVTIGSKIYLTGGRERADMDSSLLWSDRLMAYDTELETWEELTGPPLGGRGFHTCVAAEGELFAFGDWDEVEKYNPVDDSWSVVANMIVGWWYMGSVYYDGNTYLFGGQDGIWSSDRVLKYDHSQE